MKIKSGFVARKVYDCYAVVAVGKRASQFKAVITLNESGKMLWDELEKGASSDELVNKLLNEFEVDKIKAEKDVEAFVFKLKEANVIDE